jgi:hypothetical protein
MSGQSALADYQASLSAIHTGIDQARSAQNVSLGLIWAALGFSVLLFFSASERRIPLWSGALPFPVVAAAARWYATGRARWSRLLRLRNFYERGSARMENRWHGNGFAGDEFRVANHVYDSDLQILGTGSLFELVCTARTGLGRRRLAEYLLNPCDLNEALERQESVRELKARTHLRESIAVLGKFDFQESTWNVFSEWMHLPPKATSSWLRALSLASSAALGAVILAGFVTQTTWRTVSLEIPPLLAMTWRLPDTTESGPPR